MRWIVRWKTTLPGSILISGDLLHRPAQQPGIPYIPALLRPIFVGEWEGVLGRVQRLKEKLLDTFAPMSVTQLAL